MSRQCLLGFPLVAGLVVAPHNHITGIADECLQLVEDGFALMVIAPQMLPQVQREILRANLPAPVEHLLECAPEFLVQVRARTLSCLLAVADELALGMAHLLARPEILGIAHGAVRMELPLLLHKLVKVQESASPA